MSSKILKRCYNAYKLDLEYGKFESLDELAAYILENVKKEAIERFQNACRCQLERTTFLTDQVRFQRTELVTTKSHKYGWYVQSLPQDKTKLIVEFDIENALKPFLDEGFIFHESRCYGNDIVFPIDWKATYDEYERTHVNVHPWHV